MKKSYILLAILLLILAGAIAADKMYTSRLEPQFIALEKQRIITSNKLATAKIVYENLNHVRDLVFKNMDFPGQKDSVTHETIFFDFITTCINDLKLKLVSVKPIHPKTEGLITTYGYEIEIEGDFFKFGELCAKFENSRRITSLETFDVSLIEDGKQGRKRRGTYTNTTMNKGIRVKMRVDTYRVKKSANTEPVLTSQNYVAVQPINNKK
ncbi:MAG: hypothetical protein JW863_07700 [Chitinispirillaceae bacterium]|nr:hypothetical protein [Chitinispirillaceae bacterium]